MSHRDESVEIAVDEELIDGTLLTPDPPAAAAPGVLFLHGWGGSQEREDLGWSTSCWCWRVRRVRRVSVDG